MATYPHTLIDTVGVADTSLGNFALLLIEQFGLADILSIQEMMVIIEQLGLGETVDTLLQAYVHLSEGVGLNEVFHFLWSVALSETIQLDDTASRIPSLALRIIDGMVFNDLVSTRIDAVNVLIASMGLSDVLLQGLQTLISESLQLNDTLGNLFTAIQPVLEGLAFADSLGMVIGFPSAIVEQLGMDDTLTLNQVLIAAIQEGLVLTTSFMLSGETYKGWVMNSENFAVSTYSEYNFNSFAKINGKYYGVQADGLYLLEGDTDGGSFIRGIIRSAKLDFGTSNLKNISQIYIGFRATGDDVFIKLISDDDVSVWYEVDMSYDKLQTEWITTGKGVDSRYWQWELVTQDVTKLDLDSVELFPIVFKRKV